MVSQSSASARANSELLPPPSPLEKGADLYLQSCSLCRQFMAAFTDPHYLNGTNSADIVDYWASNCQGHTPLLHKLAWRAIRQYGVPDGFTITRPSIGPEVTFVCNKRTPERTSQSSISVALVCRVDQPGHPGLGRILDPQWVDLDIMRRWISICRETHGDKCDLFVVKPVQPTWLIDVKHNCLVPGANRKEYVALSYCWGQGKNFQTTTRMLEKFQVPGSLSQQEVSELLQTTINHVIKAVSAICPIPIFQASEEAKHDVGEYTPYISCQVQRLRLTPCKKNFIMAR